jgi:hypothetical protein
VVLQALVEVAAQALVFRVLPALAGVVSAVVGEWVCQQILLEPDLLPWASLDGM